MAMNPNAENGMSDKETIKDSVAVGSTAPQAEDIKALLRAHGVPILIGICVVLAAFTIVGLRRSIGQKKADEAERMLFNARSVQDISSMISKYPATPLTPLAFLKLAKAYYEAGNYDLALNKYADFKQKYPAHDLVDVAELGRLHSMEALGQTDQAMKGFDDFARNNPRHYLAPQAMFGQARCLEQQGRLNEARALYEDFVTAHPKSDWIPRVKELLDNVTKKMEGGDIAQPVETPAATAAPVAIMPAVEAK